MTPALCRLEELSLDWLTPEEPARSQLDEWFLQQGCCQQAPCQCPASFFPEVHQDYSEHKAPPVEEALTAHLCPPTAIGWKTKASHPIPSPAEPRQRSPPEYSPLTATQTSHCLRSCATHRTWHFALQKPPLLLDRHLWLNLMEI